MYLTTMIYLDTETTGLTERDRLCQIAFLVETLEDGDKQIVETLCKPIVPVSKEASLINGITNTMLEKELPFAETEVYKLLLTLNKANNILVAHNAPFDLEMLRREGIEWKGKVIDSLSCSRKLYNDDHTISSNSLQNLRVSLALSDIENNLAAAFNTRVKAHSALGDVISLYALMQHLKKHKALKTLDNVNVEETLVSLSANKNVQMEFIRFGKYNGKTFKTVAKEDPAYLEWIISCETMEASIRHSAAVVLDDRTSPLKV